MKVQTDMGLVELSDLVVCESVVMTDEVRVVATEWRYRGKIVRRDVHVIGLRLPSIGVEHGS